MKLQEEAQARWAQTEAYQAFVAKWRSPSSVNKDDCNHVYLGQLKEYNPGDDSVQEQSRYKIILVSILSM